jgi:hypothetical protein
MIEDPTEANTAARWFYGAGTFALLLALTLYYFDERLSNSPREKILSETLLELRTAQSSLGAKDLVDPRQLDHHKR